MSAYIDTSALAKCYIREPRSLEVLDWSDGEPEPTISALTLLEFRCMLARRRRAGQIDTQLERRALAEFDHHVRGGAWRVHQTGFSEYAGARDLIEVVPALPLRALDVLHLASARAAGATRFATADRVQAEAARALGFAVHDFS